MKKIKILYTIPNFDTAGSGKVLYDLAKGLDKEKFDVHIACTNNKGNFFQEVEQLGLPIHLIRTSCKITPYFTLYKRILPFKNFLQKHQFNIVHSWHWSSDWTEVLATRWAGAKFIYTKKAMTWNKHWTIKSYLTNFIITINEEMKNYFPDKKTQKLIPLGLDLNYYNPKLFPKKEEDTIFKIITVANLVPVKGIEVLINAVKKLNNTDIQLEILGDDRAEYASELKKMVIELNLQNQIIFLGKHTDVRPFLAQANLYVIPTLNEGRKEGMPMALVEAMSMSIPVLGSNISGINYVLKDFQELLFEASNEKALANKIQYIINQSQDDRLRLGTALRTYCVQHFAYENFITQHEELYLSLSK